MSDAILPIDALRFVIVVVGADGKAASFVAESLTFAAALTAVVEAVAFAIRSARGRRRAAGAVTSGVSRTLLKTSEALRRVGRVVPSIGAGTGAAGTVSRRT